MEQNRIEGTFKNHLVELPDHLRDNQKLNHIIEDTVQMPLECLLNSGRHGASWGVFHLTAFMVKWVETLHA